MSKNYVFREFECGLSVEETAKLCFKSVRAVKNWMMENPYRRMQTPDENDQGRELATSEAWEHFKMHKDTLELPTGQLVTPQEILTGIALLEIGAEPDMMITTRIMKYVRALSKIRRESLVP
ncbi:regulator [Vibrio parahaemolyticus]|nr:regulator [Vibrio parahaemolyticus]